MSTNEHELNINVFMTIHGYSWTFASSIKNINVHEWTIYFYPSPKPAGWILWIKIYLEAYYFFEYLSDLVKHFPQMGNL